MFDLTSEVILTMIAVEVPVGYVLEEDGRHDGYQAVTLSLHGQQELVTQEGHLYLKNEKGMVRSMQRVTLMESV